MPNRAVRRFVVWCPDWPVVAAATTVELAPMVPVAVFVANRVLACSGTARASGVRRGMRRRDAQGRCPELVACEHDPARDARLFEPVAAAVEALAPGVEIVRPGLVTVPVKGPAGYFGSEESAAERIVDQVAGDCGVECQVGAADGLFAAVLAARRGVLVEPGGSRKFLAPLHIAEIGSDQPGLVDLLRRLGIRTLGDFAALPSKVVATRFGAAALLAHRAACGLEERPPGRRNPPPDLTVTENLDPPVDRVDAAAFVARALAERLHARLARLGLACTRLGISARTEPSGTDGEYTELYRVWRCAEPLTPAGIADRVRWQLDGWLSGARHQRPASGVEILSLYPEEVVSAGGLQLDLIDSTTGEADARADRALVRVQGMLGPDAVLIGVPGGGRDVRDRVTFVSWGEQRQPALDPHPPWPGRIPAPSPSLIPEVPWPVTVLDAGGRPVEITERGDVTDAPCQVLVAGGRPRTVCGWAGPWPVEERWWAALPAHQDTIPRRSREAFSGRSAPSRAVIRMQVVLAADLSQSSAEPTDREEALLLAHEDGHWWAQGAYP
jgi:protein ImuB